MILKGVLARAEPRRQFAQSVGYVLAIPAPILVGALHDRTGGWRVPLAMMALLMVPRIIAGIIAGRDRQV